MVVGRGGRLDRLAPVGVCAAIVLTVMAAAVAPVTGGRSQVEHAWADTVGESATQSTFPVTFDEQGLPLGKSWSATLNGTTESSTSPTIVFDEPNGTFEWIASYPKGPQWPAPSAFAFPSSGSLTVDGSSILVQLTFLYAYPYYFEPVGIPGGVPVTLQIPDEIVTGTGAGVYLLMIPNGTYEWSATAPGYKAQNGTVTVNGTPGVGVQEIEFEPVVASSSVPAWIWAEVGVSITLIVAFQAFLTLRRRNARHRTDEAGPASHPPNSDPPEPPPSSP